MLGSKISLIKLRPDDGQGGTGGNGSLLGSEAPSPNSGETGEQGIQGAIQSTEGQQSVAPIVPEQYLPFNVIEGMEKIDDATHQQLSALGKELKLTQEQMQKVVTLGAQKFNDGQEALRLKIQLIHDEWAKKSKADPEIQPHIDMHSGSLKGITEFINRMMGNKDDTKEFLEMAAETGIGNHPSFIKFCIRTRKELGEAPFLESSRTGQPPNKMSLLEMSKSMYPTMD